jgi:hypothetical protein
MVIGGSVVGGILVVILAGFVGRAHVMRARGPSSTQRRLSNRLLTIDIHPSDPTNSIPVRN